MHEDRLTYRKALDDFHRFRSKAAMQRFWAGIRGESLDLLPFDEVSARLRAVSQTDLGLREVPLTDIVGSVNRTGDFDRNFHPLKAVDGSRWANVKAAMTSPFTQGVPPVSLYKIGDAYFVLDGNHRVSIAKEMGMESIEAFVTEVKSKVPLTSSSTLEQLVEKGALADFLEETHIDRILPNVDLSLRQFDNYPLLKEHINVHRYYMGIEQNHEIAFDDAVRDWYHHVYLPVVTEIEKSGLHDEFPDLNLTDLYLLVLDKQHSLQEWLGTPFKTENVLDYLTDRDSKQNKNDETGRDAQLERLAAGEDRPENDCLFRNILVAISDHDTQQTALKQAMLFNRQHNGTILGIHVRAEEADAEADIEELREKFIQTLESQQMSGKFFVVEGETSEKLREFSLLSDLLVLRLRFPPGSSLFERVSSGIISILQSTRRPILFVKDKPEMVERILLVFDDRDQSREAFYVAAYYAARYGCSLHILQLTKDEATKQARLNFLQKYLQMIGVAAQIETLPEGELANQLASRIEEFGITTVMMAGYESKGLMGRLFASPVDRVLETVDVPVLVF